MIKGNSDGSVQDEFVLSGSSLQENPFGTTEGQSIISTSENFWARLVRHGRPRTQYQAKMTATVNVVNGIATIYPSLGTVLYPKKATVSANVSGVAYIGVNMNIPEFAANGVANNSTVYFAQYLTGGIPWTLDFDGEIYATEGGSFTCSFQPDSVGGYATGSLYGIEVTPNA